MTKEQWELYKDFCEFSKLQDNSDAEFPNVQTSLRMFMDGTGIDGWDPLDDGSVITPEYLTYIILMAKEYWRNNGERS